jgi:coenzyme F420 hydrogenase subunit beta
MKKETIYSNYCTGCGLCNSHGDITFQEDNKGYMYPSLGEEDINLCSIVCPASGNALNHYQDGSIWGAYKKSYLGWSSDEHIRNGSSSGGILTSLCCYLLDQKLVDGIIQTRKSTRDIRRAETIVSRTMSDVMSCMGSRYTASSPLMHLKDIIKEGEVYAFVGKPCDVSALRIYMEEIRPELKARIKYLFSFFCAGQPSIDANNKLVKSLGGESLKDCKDLQYRGNGWPGYATLTKKDGSCQQMDYETSWMRILGRDVRKICRFCADGTGELADIACGDAWYLGTNGRSDFTERPGRNVIFARTETGLELLTEAINQGVIITEDFDVEKGLLRKMQPYHYTRKASLKTYKWALAFCGRSFPRYDNKILSNFAKGFPMKQKILRFGGTIQRVLKGMI